jgi:hypothetical protein
MYGLLAKLTQNIVIYIHIYIPLHKNVATMHFNNMAIFRQKRVKITMSSDHTYIHSYIHSITF